jgi:hypothetical protein
MSVGESRATILLECMLISARLLHNRSKTTMPVHLRVLGKLLSMKEPSPNGPIADPGKLSGRLLRYVIATSYSKIRRRLKNKTLSQPYIESLKQVDTLDMDYPKRDKPSPQRPQRTEHDRLFLTKFFSTTSENFQAGFPKLLKQAKTVHDQDFQLYTKDTCAEFHKLLTLLLVRFEEGLDKLHETRGSQKAPPTPCSEEFQESVESVLTCGYALQRLAHGAALRMHLKTIAHILPHLNPLSQAETSMPAPGEANEQEEEADEDLEAVQPYVKVNGVIQTHLWKSYVDWLQLILVQFDAVEVLVRYFAGKNFPLKAISIHILAPPAPNKRLLPWQELLNDSTLFPTKTTWDALSSLQSSADATNADILEFFNKSLENVSFSRYQANTVNTHWRNRDLNLTISSLEKLKSSALPGWEESATTLLSTLQKQGMPARDSDLDIQITADIKTIVQSGCFFGALASKTHEMDFGGSLHCEAFLASTLGETANVSEGLVEQMKVGYFSSSFLSPESHLLRKGMGSTIGVSKCCCPTCGHLLALLQKGRPQFIVRGTHNTITACTLPTWLPEHIVDSMNDFVGGLLRQEFIRLMDRPQLLPRRAESTGSRKLSSNSACVANDNNLAVSGIKFK